jgi:hypothetical protein
MPWTIWVALVLVLGSFSPYGAFIMLVLMAPLAELFKDVQMWWPAVPVGDATGLKPQYVWPLLAPFAWEFCSSYSRREDLKMHSTNTWQFCFSDLRWPQRFPLAR